MDVQFSQAQKYFYDLALFQNNIVYKTIKEFKDTYQNAHETDKTAIYHLAT